MTFSRSVSLCLRTFVPTVLAIVFGFGFGNTGYLFRVQSDGSDLTQLTTLQQVFDSTISSDGTKIAFISDRATGYGTALLSQAIRQL